jgi:hypothetical protein
MGAAEMPAQSKATVSQVTVGDASCNEAPAKSEPLQDAPAEDGRWRAIKGVNESRLMDFDPLIK